MENEHKLYDVKITSTAWEQMVEHARFLANVSTESANRLVDEFVESTNTLAQMPERCSWFEHDAIPFQKYRKIFFGKYYMALFEIRGSVVFITSAIDCRQDYSWLITGEQR